MYKERYKTTKFLDFVTIKVQKSSQFIIIHYQSGQITINFRVWYPLPMLAYQLGMTLSKGYHMATVPWIPWEMQCVLSNPTPWDISHGIPHGTFPMDFNAAYKLKNVWNGLLKWRNTGKHSPIQISIPAIIFNFVQVIITLYDWRNQSLIATA